MTNQPAQHKPGEHLDYLLTAYLFGSLSEAGRREVETHLAACAECRAQLAALRQTLTALEKALDPGAKSYVFEEQRRKRVMDAARQGAMPLFSWRVRWKYAAVAAALMVAVIGMSMVTLGRKSFTMSRAPIQEALKTKGGDDGFAYSPNTEGRGIHNAQLTEITDRGENEFRIDAEKIGNGNTNRLAMNTGLQSSGSDSLFVMRPDGSGGVLPSAPPAVTAAPPPPPVSTPSVGTLTLNGVTTYSGETALNAGKKSMSTFDYDNARRELERAVQADGNNAEARALLGQVNGLLGARVGRIGGAAPEQEATPRSSGAQPKAEPEKPHEGQPHGGASDTWAERAQPSFKSPSVATENPVFENEKVGFTLADSAQKEKEAGEKPVLLLKPRLDANVPALDGSESAPASAGTAPETKSPGALRVGGLLQVPKYSVQDDLPSATPATPPPMSAKDSFLSSLSGDVVDYEIDGDTRTPITRKEVALAAKDSTIRRQDEFRAQDQAEKENLAVLNSELAQQNSQLAEKNANLATQQLDKIREMDARLRDLAADQQLQNGKEIAKTEKSADLAEAERHEILHEKDHYADEKRKLAEVLVKQQQAVVVDKSGGDAINSLNYYIRGKTGKQHEAPAKSAPSSEESSAIVVPPDILAGAQLGDRFETINPDKADTQSAFGNPDARIFNGTRGNTDAPGGEGNHASSNPELPVYLWDYHGKMEGDGGAVANQYDNSRNKFAISNSGIVERLPTSAVDEKMLRGYRYLHAQNSRLTWGEYLLRPTPVPPPLLTDEGLDEDLYIERHGTRPFVDCARDHLSTFGLDVDTASYTLARSRLQQSELPDPATVRVEEFLNYFKQPYTVVGDEAFGVFAEGAPSPFSCAKSTGSNIAASGTQAPSGTQGVEILKIGIKSRDPRPNERKPAMLTFVVDTSGSMAKESVGGQATSGITRDEDSTRLGLVRGALKALVEKLKPDDAVNIVGFSDQAELVLPRTQARQKQRILDAIDALTPHGATNVETGLALGYRLADEAYSPDAVNRVILCSDGVANVGAKGPDEVLKLVKVFAGRGIDLCSIGFGMGQYNDEMMQRLADNGNGSCHFVDSLNEAEKIFREQLPSNLNVLARDAKAQVDFNPEVVQRYRLLGYEKRKIADKDFRNDKIDAGEVAHSTLITVMYEIQRKPGGHGPLGKVYLRWKDAGFRNLPVVERNYPLSEGIMAGDIHGASPQLHFLACVARLAELLRGSPWARDGSYAEVLEELRKLPPDFQARADWKEVNDLATRAQALSVQKWVKEIGR